MPCEAGNDQHDALAASHLLSAPGTGRACKNIVGFACLRGGLCRLRARMNRCGPLTYKGDL
eukprot:2750804-Rhodomonas_salina.1